MDASLLLLHLPHLLPLSLTVPLRMLSALLPHESFALRPLLSFFSEVGAAIFGGGELCELPFAGELFGKGAEVLDDALAGGGERFLGAYSGIGGDAESEGGEEGVRDFIGGEENVVRVKESGGEEVAEGVVFAGEGEDSGIREAWEGDVSGVISRRVIFGGVVLGRVILSRMILKTQLRFRVGSWDLGGIEGRTVEHDISWQ
jgi:hypothetical protein